MSGKPINPIEQLEIIQATGKLYAKAKAERTWLESFAKSRKAILMKLAEAEGKKSAAAQEAWAYAHPSYLELLDGTRTAVEVEEAHRWELTAATTAIDVWRSMESSGRAMDRATR